MVAIRCHDSCTIRVVYKCVACTGRGFSADLGRKLGEMIGGI